MRIPFGKYRGVELADQARTTERPGSSVNASTSGIDRLRAIATAVGDMPMSWTLLDEAANLERALLNRATSS